MYNILSINNLELIKEVQKNINGGIWNCSGPELVSRLKEYFEFYIFDREHQPLENDSEQGDLSITKKVISRSKQYRSTS